MKQQKEGIIYAALSYFIWGLIPIYWKFVQHVSAGEILAHRVLWSFVFMIILLLLINKWRGFLSFVKEIVYQPKKLAALLTASILVSINWGIFIWAVNSGHILQTSLGYYINPLVSVLLGVVVLKEKLSGAQILSFTLAGIGVLILTLHYGEIPWVALSLAVSFGLYGLAKKMIKVDAEIGLTLETMMVTPLAIIFMVYLLFTSKPLFFESASTSFLLMGGGIATALPLLFFAKGAQKVPLSMMGILQYIAPTMTLLIGVFMYHEPFTKIHLLSFIFIWSALLIYAASHPIQSKLNNRNKKNRIKYGA
ncbi:EamA family transporter RarD [Peribacillus psychrosaccharolyticus]|uniref:EamA family transporter RarD n=1 Tax=Peribacillus psychrosaccharolyticus TaxID=1407 RepID=A0A974NL11_PERPY|nr:EamA family transporter RarD [Peribacillus psychrosaccharolyticus]MEC2054727.1 EamA family transporter RarD [Peribacillus psychrosaccharolyticus]MED3744046.1 EamA family transporter RarD [Peribacillus psychrosaccharolyticus]QQS99542.1 EamA family transporter RarD [Peribacillus psychrosaccharolyticus]